MNKAFACLLANFPRILLLNPSIRIGDKIAQRWVSSKQAILRLQNGDHREHWEAGQFIGIVYSPQTAKPSKPSYIPEDFGPYELPGIHFKHSAPKLSKELPEDCALLA